MSKVARPHVLDRLGKVATHGSQHPFGFVVHATQSNDAAGAKDIDGVIAGWKRQGEGYGAHFLIDAEGITAQAAWGNEVCWAVAQHNTGRIHVELIGFAEFDAHKWHERPKQLQALVNLMAYEADRWHIPLVRSTNHGFAEHADFHDVPASMYHWDPGHGFPMNDCIVKAKAVVALAHAHKG